MELQDTGLSARLGRTERSRGTSAKVQSQAKDSGVAQVRMRVPLAGGTAGRQIEAVVFSQSERCYMGFFLNI